MSLYTLASLYIDTFDDYFNRIVRTGDKKLNANILDYIIKVRKDESIFFVTVIRMRQARVN